MNHASLFTGVGGFDIAAEWMGWQNIFNCEIDPFCRRVLKYYWPNAISYEDATKTDFTIHRGTIDVLSGGFPCQPVSVAGKRKGTKDDRFHWPTMFRAVREIQPRFVVAENVPGLLSIEGGVVFEQVCTDLESEWYEVQSVVIPACGKDAPHKRERVWIVAHSTSNRRLRERATIETKNRTERPKHAGELEGGLERLCGNEIVTNPSGIGLQRRIKAENSRNIEREFGRFDRIWEYFPTQSPVCNGNDGFPNGLAGITFPKWRKEAIKAMGNAVVPQVVYEIFKAIEISMNKFPATK